MKLCMGVRISLSSGCIEFSPARRVRLRRIILSHSLRTYYVPEALMFHFIFEQPYQLGVIIITLHYEIKIQRSVRTFLAT